MANEMHTNSYTGPRLNERGRALQCSITFFDTHCISVLDILKYVCQPSCIAHRNQYSGHFSGREIQVFDFESIKNIFHRRDTLAHSHMSLTEMQ